MMTHTNTADLPAWAGWLAMDSDGTWWAYEHEPNQSDSGWYENEVGRRLRLGSGETGIDWERSLRRIRR